MTLQKLPLHPGYTDTLAKRGNLTRSVYQQTGELWQVQEIASDQQTYAIMSQTPVFRPRLTHITLGPGFKLSQIEALEAHVAKQGLTVVEVKEHAGYALAAALTPAIKTLRRSLAAALKIYPHQLDLNATWAGEGHLAEIEVRRFPQMTSDAAQKVLLEWLTLVLDSVRAAKGWTILVSPLEQQVHMTYGEPRRLPRKVPFSEIALAAVDPTKWSKIPVGRTPSGTVVEADLKAGPHTLIVGNTSSGKSVTSRVIIAGALARGFEVICADPTKKMAGQKEFIPYTKGFFVKSVAETAEMLKAVYAEVRRRVELIDQADAENWQDLPAGTLRPWMVLIDEWAGLISLDKKPGGDPKTSDEVFEALAEWNAHSNHVSSIQTSVAKIAREARSAGVHLIIITQRPDANDLPGQVREQLGTRFQQVLGKPPSREALTMLFPGDGCAQAAEEITDLMEDRAGFALSYIDGASVEGFQVALIEGEEVAPYLDSIGVPKGVPLSVSAAAKNAPTPEPEPEPAPEPAWTADPAPEPAWATGGDPF